MLQESAHDTKTAEHVAQRETSHDKELVILQKERGITLRPETFIDEVDTIQ